MDSLSILWRCQYPSLAMLAHSERMLPNSIPDLASQHYYNDSSFFLETISLLVNLKSISQIMSGRRYTITIKLPALLDLAELAV